MTRKFSPIVLPSLLAILGGAVLTTASEAGASDRSTPAATLAGQDSAELSRAMRELAQEIASLRASLQAGGIMRREATADFPPDATSSADGDRLSSVVEQLVARLCSVAPGSADLDDIAPAVGSKTNQKDRLAALRTQSEEERSRTHFFWSYRRVLEKYGRPDSLYTSPESGLNLIYQGATPEAQLGFNFHDGLVVRVWCN